MNAKPRRLLIALGALPIVGIFVWWLSAVLWLPDLVSPGAIHVISLVTLANRETVELTQQWVGDGYLTGVRHSRNDGSTLYCVGDGDFPRAFRCHTLISTNSGFVEFRFSGKQRRYYWGSRGGGQFLSLGDGQAREPM